MKLLGDWNWYLPRWLEWLPHLDHGGPVDEDRRAGRARTRRLRAPSASANPSGRISPMRPLGPNRNGGTSDLEQQPHPNDQRIS